MNVYCKKCGALADSKCPYCRSVFPENRQEALLSRVLQYSLELPKLRVSLRLPVEVVERVERGEEDEDYAIREGHKILYDILHDIVTDEKMLREWACDHQWAFRPGCKSLIGCGHGDHSLDE